MAQQHTLFLACTRPALIMGIPLEAFLACLGFCDLIFLVSGLFPMSPTAGVLRLVWLFGSLVVCYVVCRYLSARDHNIFRILWIWLNTKGRTSRNAEYWGGSSLSPAPLRRPRKPHEITYLG